MHEQYKVYTIVYLMRSYHAAYKEKIGPKDGLTLQVRSAGMLIDVFGEEIEDRMKMTVIVEKKEVDGSV